MSDPRRMLEVAGTDDLALELLRAGRAEEPSARARQRAMVAAGVASAATATTMAAVTSAAAAEASLPPVAAKAGASVAGLVVKWIGIAAVGGLGLWGAWQLSAPEPSASALSHGLTRPLEDVDLVTPIAELGTPTPSPEAEPSRDRDQPGEVETGEHPVPVAEPVPLAVAGTPKRSGHLVEEVAAIDRARTAMSDDPEAALAELEAYRRDFAGGALAQEAEVLRIESLARSGRADQAREAATVFLAAHPDSPLAARVRAVSATP